MIYVRNRSGKRKNPTQKQKAEYQAWLDSVNSTSTNFSQGKKVLQKNNNIMKFSDPPRGNQKVYKSVGATEGVATKPIHSKVYTGTAMKGIGTLHKSNAVPIFSLEDAVDQARMRR